MLFAKFRNFVFASRKSFFLSLLILLVLVVTPVAAAVIVQSQNIATVTVEEPPIEVIEGSDPSTTNFLNVDIGNTVSIPDAGPTGTNNVILNENSVEFACFQGDRTYYEDVLQLDNNSGELWDINITVEESIAGGVKYDNNTLTGGDIDIFMFVSEINSASSGVTERPNPSNYGTPGLTEWYDGGGNEAIKIEIDDGVFTDPSPSESTGQFSLPNGEQRQIAIVVDCGDDTTQTESGIFRFAIEQIPN